MITMNDIVNWARLDVREEATFESTRARPVTLDVNTSGPVALYVRVVGEDEERLLALVTGRETVKFVVPGTFTLFHTSDEDVYILTADGTIQHRQDMGLEKFTLIHERRKLDGDTQAVVDALNRNHQRNYAAMQRQIESLQNAVRNATSAPRTVLVEPKSDDGQQASGTDAGQVDDVTVDNGGS